MTVFWVLPACDASSRMSAKRKQEMHGTGGEDPAAGACFVNAMRMNGAAIKNPARMFPAGCGRNIPDLNYAISIVSGSRQA